ncbi:MAG: glutathione S-transferase N-terminal domain-containing protein [Anaerolineae bacterium]|nr:glutathione S-transferase N-terminal domain-containing protein [Anaerolineae bacterium]
MPTKDTVKTTDKPKAKKKKRVLMFSTPSCRYCVQAKRYFREKGVRFREVDVSKDPAAARDMVRMSGQQGVPVIKIGGKVMVGFNKPEIDRLLGL